MTGIGRVFSRPGLFIMYGRPGSYKTALALKLVLRAGDGGVYLGAGKHALLCGSPGRCIRVNTVEELLKNLLDVLREPPRALAVDGVETLLIPLWYLGRRGPLQLLLYVLSTLKRVARSGCSCYVTLLGGERPHFYNIVRRVDGVTLVRLDARKDVVIADIMGARQRVLSRLYIPVEELEEVYQRGSEGEERVP